MKERYHIHLLQPILCAPAIGIGIIVDIPPDVAVIGNRASYDSALVSELMKSYVLARRSYSDIELSGGYLDSISYDELVCSVCGLGIIRALGVVGGLGVIA